MTVLPNDFSGYARGKKELKDEGEKASLEVENELPTLSTGKKCIIEHIKSWAYAHCIVLLRVT